MSAAPRTRRRLPSEIFDLPVEKIREGYYSDAYFVYTKQVLELDGHHPRVLMQVFQRQQSVLGGMDEAIAVLRECCGRAGADGAWQAGWDELVVRALHDGDEIEPWETVMTIEGDYALFCHLETVYLGTLSRRTLIATQRARGRGRGARQADPLLPGAPRPLPRADRRRLRRPHRRRDRRLDRRAGLLVGRARAGHRAARADRGLRRRHGAGGASASPRRSAREMDVIVLVDFDNDCVGTALAVARGARPAALGRAAGHLDTMVDRSLSPQMGRFDPRGVNPQLVRNVREALDARASRASASSPRAASTWPRSRAFEDAGVPVDAYGVGSALIRGENDFTADVVVRDGQAGRQGRARLPAEPAARGRELSASPR